MKAILSFLPVYRSVAGAARESVETVFSAMGRDDTSGEVNGKRPKAEE
jgi:hypothetical protein